MIKLAPLYPDVDFGIKSCRGLKKAPGLLSDEEENGSNTHIIDEPIGWLSDQDWAMFAVIMISVWKLFPFIVIAVLTDLTPLVSQANFIIFNFSSGSSTFPDKKIFPSRTFVFIYIKYLLLVKESLASKFFCIIESSICIPTVLGS